MGSGKRSRRKRKSERPSKRRKQRGRGNANARVTNTRRADESPANVAQPLVAYHHVVFARLTSELKDAITGATLEPRRVRHAYWSVQQRIGSWSGEQAW